MAEKMLCPKCGENMELGTMVDSVGSGTARRSRWIEKIEVGFFGLKGKPKNVVTYRCNKCGYLESYAKEG